MTELTTTTSVPSGIGSQAFAAYKHTFAVLAQIEGSPTGRATDPRLAADTVDPWYSEVVQAINLFRFKNEVVKGYFSFSDFRLDEVTPDGRVIFTDCQTNSQEVYSAKTGTPVINSGTRRIPEQVVVYHPTAEIWKVADDNTGTTGSANACAD